MTGRAVRVEEAFMTSRYDLRGRQAILHFWRLSEWRAVLRRIRFGAPVIREPDGTWVASSVELDEWSSGKMGETLKYP